MGFGDQNWDTLLPSYLSDTNKDRLRKSLEQFQTRDRGQITYDDFYRDYNHDYFMQGDLVLDIRTAIWESESRTYSKVYTKAIIISNSCDLSFDNKRGANPKQCVFAPVIKLDQFLEDLQEDGFTAQQIDQYKRNLRSQEITNVFYLPGYKDSSEHIALLDQIFWYPIEELQLLIETIGEERLSSLNQFGYYLFVLKVSYHFCRLPEQCDRELTA